MWLVFHLGNNETVGEVRLGVLGSHDTLVLGLYLYLRYADLLLINAQV